jgi:hypothetical protein
MPAPRAISPEAREQLAELLGKAENKTDFQRIQCVWLRAELGLSSAQVALALGWRPATVRKIWSHYLARGENTLWTKARGGRRRANFSLEEESLFLKGFFQAAEHGGGLVVRDVKEAYERAVGRAVPKSTIYRMLARHGWRKTAGQTRGPKIDSVQADPRDVGPGYRPPDRAAVREPKTDGGPVWGPGCMPVDRNAPLRNGSRPRR